MDAHRPCPATPRQARPSWQRAEPGPGPTRVPSSERLSRRPTRAARPWDCSAGRVRTHRMPTWSRPAMITSPIDDIHITRITYLSQSISLFYICRRPDDVCARASGVPRRWAVLLESPWHRVTPTLPGLRYFEAEDGGSPFHAWVMLATIPLNNVVSASAGSGFDSAWTESRKRPE